MGRTRHSFGGIEDISKTLGDGFQGSCKPSARPVGAIGTTLGKDSQHPWKAFPWQTYNILRGEGSKPHTRFSLRERTVVWRGYLERPSPRSPDKRTAGENDKRVRMWQEESGCVRMCIVILSNCYIFANVKREVPTHKAFFDIMWTRRVINEIACKSGSGSVPDFLSRVSTPYNSAKSRSSITRCPRIS